MQSHRDIIRKLNFPAVLSILLFVVAGCSSTGVFKGEATSTDVSLSQKNYKVIKAGTTGQSYGFKFLGLIPITSPTHATAKQSLYQPVGEPLTGRAVALANQTEDRSSLYLILFSIPKVTITAGVIEFTESSAGSTNK